jgi:eukaryotic-like serine/threonine-protein kinase
VQRRRLKLGTRLGRHLTVLGLVDPHSGDPVYLMWHHEAWCPMACKVFGSLHLAQREADRLQRLDHPGIVRCLGVEQPACLLMEFLEGPTVRKFARARRAHKLPHSDALRIANYIGSALIHLHARGLLHLDVKPANVIIYRARPVLIDVGTAMPRRRARLDKLVGTDEYMAPEQCAKGRVTTAADVFSLGVMLYEILTGRLPFPAGTRRNPFPQRTAAPTPLKYHLPRAPAALDALLAACLAREPGQRPSLPVLLPALHRLISCGPAMWPAGFDPQSSE